jgi:hypothetical protein
VSSPERLLSPEQRAALARGAHEAVAAELARAGLAAAAGWVLEQIWDFLGAHAHYLAAELPLDALRCALETGRPDLLDHTLALLEQRPRPERDAAVAMLARRARHAEAARLLAADDADPAARARALLRAGDRLGAAQVLADAGLVREGPRRPRAAGRGPHPQPRPRRPPQLGARRRRGQRAPRPGGHARARGPGRGRYPPPSPTSPPARTLAHQARAALPSGPAAEEPAATNLALETGLTEHVAEDMPFGTGPIEHVMEDRAELPRLLARGLAALGHELAAQLVLQGAGAGDARPAALPGRYRVRRALPASFSGAAYDGLDRVTQQEVEIHLLLAEVQDAGLEASGVQAALAGFARRAEAAAELAHPAIRGVLRFDREAGLLILPHADGPPLRALIRPPGMPPARARALIGFLLDGLAAAHARGLVHGSLLPTQIVADALGRPLLGPFGADEIAGLVATRTGALEELLTFTAPELRSGGRPSPASDVFSAAALLLALRTGSLAAPLERLPAPEQALVADALDPDPARRPDAETLRLRLHRRVADARELAPPAALPAVPQAMSEQTATGAGLVVAAAASWSDPELDALLASDAPRLQPVLDREGRRVVLAPWPEGCRRLADDADAGALVTLLDELAAPLRAALLPRLRPAAWVWTPGGAWMLALDDLLLR